ncbi:MAG: 2-oxo acid dehydrogenase subunit E2 [Thermoflexales bacterium]|nr:2-oxo acid dehydrogenase subunit E2 [Thermoflexales bacterium]
MATEITMPQMGFDMTEGTVANWLKALGDPVKKGEPIAEIETDKTTIQIEAFGSGVLSEIRVAAGTKVPVGSVIGVIGAPGEAPGTAAAPAAKPAAAPAQAGGQVTPVARRMAEELGVDLSTVSGTGREGAITKADIEAAAKRAATPAPATGRIVASPAAKSVAAAAGVDLRAVKGSGPEGRIMKADVEAVAPAAPRPAAVAAAAAPSAALPAAVPAAPLATVGDQRKPLSKMRQIIATRTQQSKVNAPHFYITVATEMDAALALRGQVNESLKAEGIKVSVNDLVVRAVALALRKFPSMNASFAGDAIDYHGAIHVGNAVALESGLITVTVRDADAKSLKQIAVEMAGLVSRAKSGKMLPGDAGGQTFSISNLGMYGVENFVAIINGPDAGILAVAAAQPEAVVRDGQIVIRSIMRMTLSGDHRVTDGAQGAEFVNEIKRLLENPWGLVL